MIVCLSDAEVEQTHADSRVRDRRYQVSAGFASLDSLFSIFIPLMLPRFFSYQLDNLSFLKTRKCFGKEFTRANLDSLNAKMCVFVVNCRC